VTYKLSGGGSLICEEMSSVVAERIRFTNSHTSVGKQTYTSRNI